MSKATSRAVKLLQQGYPTEFIHQQTGLSFEAIATIRDSLMRQHLLGETRRPEW